MKIIYYSPHPTHDIVSEVGYSTHQRETIEAMRSLGHEVLPVIMGGTEKAVVEKYHGDIVEKSRLKKFLVGVLPKFLLNGLKDIQLMRHDQRAAMELEKSINQFRPDLVYERNEYMQDKGTRLCIKRGVKHFLEVNSPAVEEMRSFEGPDILHFLGKRKERYKIRHTHRIIVVSSALKKYLEDRFSPPSPIIVTPNGVNPENIRVNGDSGITVRQKLGWEDAFVMGFVGSIFPHHGVNKLIEAFSMVVKENANLRLCIVGDGFLRPELESLAARILPTNSFVFTGKLPHQEAMNYVNAFDCCVMPDSNWYGSPVKILEYGWLGKPILAPDLDPIRDLMDDGEDGYLFPPGASALANRMKQVLENGAEATRRALHFQAKIKQNFTWNKLTEKILSVD